MEHRSEPSSQDKCADCYINHGIEPSMRNSRETGKMRNGEPVTERHPGFLCVECWKNANPIMFNRIANKPGAKADKLEKALKLLMLVSAALAVSAFVWLGYFAAIA